MTAILRRARELQPGHKLFFTLETVTRTFTDSMTPAGYVNVTLQKPCGKTRTAVYKTYKRIKLYMDA
jgi:hypothetical protein